MQNDCILYNGYTVAYIAAVVVHCASVQLMNSSTIEMMVEAWSLNAPTN